MTVEYKYEDLEKLPCLAYMDEFAGPPTLPEKFCDISMHPVEMWLHVWFEDALSTEDKAALDTVVSDSLGKKKVVKRREVIMGEIFALASQDQAQIGRLLDALDNYPGMAIALDNLNYALARMRVEKVYTDGAITEADRDLVLSTIPTEEYE